MPRLVFTLPDGQEVAREIPPERLAQFREQNPELAQQLAPFSTAGLEGLGIAAQQTGSLIGQIAKQEAIPTTLAALAPMLLPAGVGAATRLGAAAASGLAGRYTNAALGLQPAPTVTEAFGELFLGGAPEAAARILDPSAAAQVVRALGGKGGVRAGLTATEQATAVGGALRRHVGDIRAKVGGQLDSLFAKTERLAAARNLGAEPSQRTLEAANEVLANIDTIGLNATERIRIQNAVQTLSGDQSLSFGELRRLWRQVGELGDSFTKTLGRGPRNPLNTLAGALKQDMRTAVAGTPAEMALERADNYFVNTFLPATRAIRNIDNAMPEDVVNALVSKPSRLRQVLAQVDKPTADNMRTAWIADALEDSRDLAGLPDVDALQKRFRTLKGTARRFVIEDQASFRRSVERLQELTGREGFINQFRLLQSSALVGMGAGVGAAFTTGDVSSGLAAMLGTTAGVYSLARILNNTQARRLFNKGLAAESRNARLAGRLILQAGERAGIDWAAPHLRFDAVAAEAPTQMVQPPAAAPAF